MRSSPHRHPVPGRRSLTGGGRIDAPRCRRRFAGAGSVRRARPLDRARVARPSARARRDERDHHRPRRDDVRRLLDPRRARRRPPARTRARNAVRARARRSRASGDPPDLRAHGTARRLPDLPLARRSPGGAERRHARDERIGGCRARRAGRPRQHRRDPPDGLGHLRGARRRCARDRRRQAGRDRGLHERRPARLRRAAATARSRSTRAPRATS